MPIKVLAMKLTPSRIFLLDGVGAFISALMLGIVLVRLQSIIGLPVSTLYLLAAIALVFAANSMTCFFARVSNWNLLLKVIAVANLAYCVLTGALVVANWETITALGVIYFGLEILIIVILVLVEWRISTSRHATTTDDNGNSESRAGQPQ